MFKIGMEEKVHNLGTTCVFDLSECVGDIWGGLVWKNLAWRWWL